MIDIGVNLLHPQFDGDREAVLQRAREAGITDMIITGTNIAESRGAMNYCETLGASLFCTAGIHPHDARNAAPGWQDALRALAQHPRVVAIGETGLDFNRNFSPPEAQETVFRGHLAVAREIDLPLFVHDRDASATVLHAFREVLGPSRNAATNVVVHCFTGNAAALSEYLALGCYIGITGWLCDHRRGAGLRALVPEIPLDRLLVETDAPFLRPQNAPAGADGRRNEPALLPYVIQKLAQCLGEDPERIAEWTARNARRLFRLPLPS